MASEREHLTKTYRFALGICVPAVRWWGRLEVEGLEHVPPTGPLIVAGNHDSYWDPVVIGIAAIKLRQIRALAKSSLWEVKGLHLVLNGMRQIPVQRGKGDTDAMARAMDELRGGSCVGMFPEGTRSLGRKLRARSGIGRMAAAVPEAKIVCGAVSGTTDIVRFPKRPRLKVTFFEPRDGQIRPGEDPTALAVRITADMRVLAPISAAGRRPKAIAAAADAPPAPGAAEPSAAATEPPAAAAEASPSVADAPDAQAAPPGAKPSG